MSSIQSLLDERIEKEIQGLSLLSTGTEQKTAAIEDLTKLYKLKIEEAKVEQAKEQSSNELELKQIDAKAQARDRWISYAVQGVLTIGGWIVYDIWFRRGLRFEETGSIRAPMTRNLLSRMLPKK